MYKCIYVVAHSQQQYLKEFLRAYLLFTCVIYIDEASVALRAPVEESTRFFFFFLSFVVDVILVAGSSNFLFFFLLYFNASM